ncbi:hypothetical protein KHP62_13020 [Rhodobacteraceae bacterium NNCM2]|nr:hypothetical protein [Coraliihabitans acroporae]
MAMTCSICWWEADGPLQSEDEPRSANHNYTLRQARQNFLDHGHMYDLGREISYLKSESDERIALLQFVRRVMTGEAEFSQDILNSLLKAENERIRDRTCAPQLSDLEEETLLRALLSAKPDEP